jgi:hypothetical protein
MSTKVVVVGIFKYKEDEKKPFETRETELLFQESSNGKFVLPFYDSEKAYLLEAIRDFQENDIEICLDDTSYYLATKIPQNIKGNIEDIIDYLVNDIIGLAQIMVQAI